MVSRIFLICLPIPLQGGAIYAVSHNPPRLKLEIYASQFISNDAGHVSRFCSCYLAVL
jgi:hypothetical protein